MALNGENKFYIHRDALIALEFDKILEYLAAHTHSPLTREKFLNTYPLTNVTEIDRQLSLVSELRAILDFDDAFPMEDFDDIRSCLKKARIAGNFLEPAEFLKIRRMAILARQIRSYFTERSQKYLLLEKLAENLAILTPLEKEIERIIDENSHTVKDRASSKLAQLRREILSSQDHIRKRVESIQRDWAGQGHLQEALITLRDDRFVLMVKEQHRHRIKGVVHDQSASGATLFIEPLETIEMSNQLRQLQLAERREVERILIALTDTVREQAEGLENNLRIVIDFDHIYTRADFSRAISGCQPQINTQNRLHLLTARHPLLILKYGKPEKVIPVTLEMGEKFFTLIISGPNAGGKTVTIKTIGLLALMLQSGLHVPVFPDSEIPIFSAIFADIGDLQSIENDLSTFSSHIQKLTLITEKAVPNALVLIDEIGAGTDPEEGAALAASILEKLTKIRCITIATTHHGALKAFAYETPGVENGSMEFDTHSFKPTYHFRMGIPGSSYAFEIAQRFGLATDIIENARQFVGVEKQKVENLIIDLDQRLRQESQRVHDLEQQQKQLDELTRRYEQKLAELNQNQRKLKQQAIEEAEKIIRQANALIEHSIQEIREQKASRPTIQHVKKELKQHQERLETEAQKIKITTPEKVLRPVSPDQITSGLRLLWKKFNQKARVIEGLDSSGKVMIETGHVKVRVPLNELAALNESEAPATVHDPIVRFDMPSTFSTEIDLRGLRAEEAIQKVDKFIDEALLVGLQEIRIIHGKGTGALKDTINQFLNKHPAVKTQRQGEWNAGAAGVTVVTLKH